MLIVSSQAGVVGMTREHVTLSNALEVPLFVVVTKTDLGSDYDTVEHIKQLLTSPGVRKVITEKKSFSNKIQSFTCFKFQSPCRNECRPITSNNYYPVFSIRFNLPIY